MKFPMIILLSLTFSLAVSTATLAQSAEDEQAIRDQLARFYEGYNEHDADKMVSIYADDADHINVFAEWRKGKPAVREALKRLHAGPGKNDHKTYTIEKIRFIKPDVAVIQVRSLSKPCACGNLSTFVMTKESGKWLVVSFANVEYKLDPKGDKTGITKMPSKVPAGGQLLVVPSGAGQKLANDNEWKIMGYRPAVAVTK